jgi:Flp pilus assembly protein TadG
LLVLFVIGILDFSGALTLKQKLTNAAREGARVAAADPATDLVNTAPLPVSVTDAFYVVDNYLLAEKISDCGIGVPTSSSALVWTSTAVCAGGNSFTLTINRGFVAKQVSGPNTTYAINTQVKITYPYAWKFGPIAGLFGGFTLPTGITTSSVAFNEN